MSAKRSAYAAVAAMIDECLRARLRPVGGDLDRGPVHEGEAAVLRELEAISKAMFAASQVKP